MDDLDNMTHARSSTLGTGGGTDHDDTWIRARPTYRWEGLLNESPRTINISRGTWLAKLGAWFGITPLWRARLPSQDISLDVTLENGRYIIT